MGDFNINYEDKSTRKPLKNIMRKYDLVQVVKGPTRITTTTQTQIDLIFSNKSELILKSFNMITGLSDHNLTLISRELPKRRPIQTEAKNGYFKIPKSELPNFNTKINEINWSDLLHGIDADADSQLFISTIQSILKHFQRESKSRRFERYVLPWINEDILK